MSWLSSVKHSASSCGRVSAHLSLAAVCGVDGDGATGCYGHCSGKSTAHTYKASRPCEIACGPLGGAHRPKQMGRDGSDEVSLLFERGKQT